MYKNFSKQKGSTVYLDEEILRELEDIALTNSFSRSTLMRRLILQGLEKIRNKGITA